MHDAQPNNRPWLLIDGYNLAFRGFYGVTNLARSDGFPTNAIYAWVTALWKLQTQFQPKGMLVFFDLGPSKRHLELLPEYKANRIETPEAFKQQTPWMKQLVPEMGYRLVEREGVEADDLIGAYARHLDQQKESALIASSDKDFGQCVTETIQQLLPPNSARKQWTPYDLHAIQTRYGVRLHQIPDYLALIGDTADNIPGVPGIGPKTAARLLQQFPSIDVLIERSEEISSEKIRQRIQENAALLRTTRGLTQLDLNLQVDLSLLKPCHTPSEALLESLKVLELHRLADKLSFKKKKAGTQACPPQQSEFSF